MINPQEETIKEKPKKEFKQSPEVREYFKNYHHKRRLRLTLCSCGNQAEYKEIKTKKKLCEVCIMRQIIQKNKAEKEKQTNAMPIS